MTVRRIRSLPQLRHAPTHDETPEIPADAAPLPSPSLPPIAASSPPTATTTTAPVDPAPSGAATPDNGPTAVEPATPDADTSTRVPHDEDDEPEDLDDLAAWWAGTNYDETTLDHFRRGNGAPLPPVAAMTGSDLIALTGKPASCLPRLAERGLVASTRMEHLRMLRTLSQIPADLHKAPMTTAIIEHLMRLRKAHHWRWSTAFKHLCCAQGALNLLPLYRLAPALQLSACPVWRQAMRAAQIACRQELPRQPRPATWQEVEKTLRTEKSLPVFSAILLSWMTCARVGCILQLSRPDIDIRPDHTLSVRFRKGKSVRTRGPYVVHTAPVPAALMPRLQRWLDQRKTTLFPTRPPLGVAVKEALRRTNPALEQRSLRRGSLQTVARTPGMTDATLMELSGHTQVSTLRRYLSWGQQAPFLADRMRQAGQVLTRTEPLQC